MIVSRIRSSCSERTGALVGAEDAPNEIALNL